MKTVEINNSKDSKINDLRLGPIGNGMPNRGDVAGHFGLCPRSRRKVIIVNTKAPPFPAGLDSSSLAIFKL